MALVIEKNEGIQSIDCSISVWHVESKTIVFTEDHSQYTFDDEDAYVGYSIGETLPEENNYIITIKFLKWDPIGNIKN